MTQLREESAVFHAAAVSSFGLQERLAGPVEPLPRDASIKSATQLTRVFTGAAAPLPPLSRELSERLYEIGRVVDAVSSAYRGDWEAIDKFLNRAHPLLEGETPFDMARSSSAGADAVLNLIRRAEAGVAP